MELETLRHSCAHVMAQAVKRLFPGTKLGIGPAIEDGFYYDFASPHKFTLEDLEKIEREMQRIIEEDFPFVREEISKPEAEDLFRKLGEDFKLELIREISEERLTVYRSGEFVDLCRGPHIASTGKIKAFKLLSLAGAYWHGIETNPMLQRIYGTSFLTQEELEEYLHNLEETKKRDHRKLGKELEFFSIHEEAGAGLVFYHPKGAILRTIIEDYEKKEHLKRGYQLVITPHILRSDIWRRSGHYSYYKENMYIFQIENQEFAVKPMNCPGHILIYKSKIRSYRDLPLRFFELGSVYRNEKTGVLHGLLRVRGFTQDDAHIFCTEEQGVEEIEGVIDFVLQTMRVFGFTEYEVELSTRPSKSIGTDQEWGRAEAALKKALNEKGLNYKINPGEGAFYGPKIDIKLKDALKRTWQCATVQCDFALPERFDLTYVSADGSLKRPIMLHRVILGSMERFIGTLLEHYGGALPVWLSPVQIVIIPLAERFFAYGERIKQRLGEENLRVEIDLRDEKMQYKIRQAQLNKIPYMLIVGEKEMGANTVGVRERKKGDLGQFSLEDFIQRVKQEIVERR
ncbi:MAG: threonine--tRNA ligase [Candidatus Omnitrophica bacterium]|nr:threonine--tRNA ligase [Candidatus Omnitrophota bacterium]MCM8798472.1 threonine--tRNA ligase [Candidatus Omnitrophota bacterium]